MLYIYSQYLDVRFIQVYKCYDYILPSHTRNTFLLIALLQK